MAETPILQLQVEVNPDFRLVLKALVRVVPLVCGGINHLCLVVSRSTTKVYFLCTTRTTDKILLMGSIDIKTSPEYHFILGKSGINIIGLSQFVVASVKLVVASPTRELAVS